MPSMLSLEKLVENKDYYMNLNDTTGINSLAIEKSKGDGGSIFYDSDVPEDYLSNPCEATSSSLMSKDELSSLFKNYKMMVSMSSRASLLLKMRSLHHRIR